MPIQRIPSPAEPAIEVVAFAEDQYQTVDDYIRELVKKGMKRIGEGSYAVVFKHPKDPNVVVRVSSYYNDAAAKWHQACLKELKGNPWVPKVLALYKAKYKASVSYKEECYITFLEKLQRAGGSVFRDPFIHRLMYYTYKAIDSEARHWLKVLANEVDDPKLSQVLRFISTKNPDISYSNIMVRPSTKQIVFSDPIQ